MRSDWEVDLACDSTRLQVEEMDLLVPLLDREGIYRLLAEIDRVCCPIVGEKKAVSIDLEQLQVTDRTLGVQNDKLAEFAQNLLTAHYRPLSDLYYLSLRSLITMEWQDLERRQDLGAILQRELSLNSVLSQEARDLATARGGRMALPYWARLSYLQLVESLPATAVNRAVTDRTVVTVLMSREPNAFAIFHPEGDIIALNVVLEPLLKHLNGVFKWFLNLANAGTRIRTSSLVTLLLPTILYFWHGLPVQRLPLACMLPSKDSASVKWLTGDQIKFIVAHEMGHIFLGHNRPDTRCDLPASALVPGTPRLSYYSRDQVMELDADCFALNYAKASFMNGPVVHPAILKRHAELERKRGIGQSWRRRLASLFKRDRLDATAPARDYGTFRTAAEVLFLIFRLVEEGSALLEETLDETSTSTTLRTHPSAEQRLQRLREFNAGDLQPSASFVEFVGSVVDKTLATMRAWTPEDARMWVGAVSTGDEPISQLLTQARWRTE